METQKDENKNYTVVKKMINDEALNTFFSTVSQHSNNLKNVVIYHCRQWYFYTQNLYRIFHPSASFKPYQYDTALIDRLKQYMFEFNRIQTRKPDKKPYDFVKNGLTPYFLQFYLLRINQSDYKSNVLSAQMAQQIVKQTVSDFKNFKKALIDYFKNPTKYKAKPELPKYKKKQGLSGFMYTNQDTQIKNGQIRLPKTKLTIPFSYEHTGRYIRMTVTRKYDQFELQLVFEKPENQPVTTSKQTDVYAGLDLGVNNIVAIATNKGQSLLVKDKTLKALNQYTAKQIALIQSRQTTSGALSKPKSSKRIQQLYKHRYNKTEQFLYLLTKQVLTFCLQNNVSTLVIGKNDGWKQNSNKGSKNNQNFCMIPFNNFIFKLTYKLQQYGITVIEREESYTSKANSLKYDFIPTYGNVKSKPIFTGKRTERGLYKTNDNHVLNADVNGALNILRKEFPKLKLETSHLHYLKNPNVITNIYTHESKPKTVQSVMV